MSFHNTSQKHDLAGKRIIVTGAGLAGLAFACAIERYWPAHHPKPKLVIYERSAKELDRSHAGYTMGIRAESGLLALKQLGLLDTALRATTVGANGADKAPTFWASNWKPIFDPSSFSMFNETVDGMPKSGIRLVRYVLRDMLLDALSADTEVHWGSGCQKTRILPDGKVQVELAKGTTDTGDLLVAADGANSSVRNLLLPDENLEYTGAVCFLGTSRFAEGKPELLKHKWGMNISGQGVPFLTLYVIFFPIAIFSFQPCADLHAAQSTHIPVSGASATDPLSHATASKASRPLNAATRSSTKSAREARCSMNLSANSSTPQTPKRYKSSAPCTSTRSRTRRSCRMPTLLSLVMRIIL